MKKSDRQHNKKKEIGWRAAEHDYIEKGALWYWVLGTIAVILMLIALWQKNFFFFIFLAIALPMLFFFAKRRPRILNFQVSEKGVGIGKRVFEYSDLEGFHVREREHSLDEIILKKKAVINPFVRIPVDADTREKIEKVFDKKLKRIEYEDSFLDAVSEWFGL